MNIIIDSVKKFFNFEKEVNKRSDKLIRANNFDPITLTNPNDIFIVGFPKSGNTWMQNLMACILLDSISERLTPQLVNELVPDVHSKTHFKRFFDKMLFKSHELPKEQYKRVIHLIRDGRDSMVSYYNMGKNKNVNFNFTLKEMIIDGKGINPSKWYYHTQEWIKNPFKADICAVRYEDLILQPLIELQRICKFINIEMSAERLEAIIEHNSINNLRNRVSVYGMDNDHTWNNKPITSFFRKGKIGSYKEEMDEELITYFINESEKELKHFGYL